jgi:hypothetical protein
MFELGIIVTVAAGAIFASIAIAEPSKDAKPGADAAPEMKLPPGWTAEDMQALIVAGTPGKQQEMLVKDAGTWQGKQQMWMPGSAEPMTSDVRSTITPMMDGRYTKVEVAGEVPGMGPYTGLGIYGFDNVSQQFVCTWIDNHSTGTMNGVGELSPDGKTITWQFTYNCPIIKKPTAMRQIETNTGPNTKKLEMFGNDPKSGKEYKMMTMELTRK